MMKRLRRKSFRKTLWSERYSGSPPSPASVRRPCLCGAAAACDQLQTSRLSVRQHSMSQHRNRYKQQQRCPGRENLCCVQALLDNADMEAGRAHSYPVVLYGVVIATLSCCVMPYCHVLLCVVSCHILGCCVAETYEMSSTRE